MAQYGSFAHLLLQNWANDELEIYDLLGEYENRYNQHVTMPFPTLRNGQSMGEKYYDDGYKFFSEFSGVGDYKILSAEEEFEIQIEDFILTGFIDLRLEDKDGNLIVWDWKSKNGFEDEEEERKYRRQLYLYSHYIYRKYGKYPTETVFYCFRQQREYRRPFDMDEYNRSIEWMFDTVKVIRKLYCQYDYFFCNQLCGFRTGCPMKREVEGNPHWKSVIKSMKPAKGKKKKKD